MTQERYIIRYGKFGAYFYDIKHKKDMTLEEVTHTLNYCNNELVEKFGYIL